ncbi:SDR family oxidoreductase [Sphingomonas sp. S2-65]|uniref:SDR family oxidoreductase n=1 Tax=Sphingomonas sp. S2-65 TaxID=2903960 RepID=UPI001F1EEF25|nr:SDR family oxidoreductase [Sphingomonas sp. S2-65]UYY58561.1 SDR family oxidoreductase [Sphingomonas sp. S2-65]
MDQRVCIVTGGTRGLGWAAVQMLAEQGHTVIAASRHPEAAQPAIDALVHRGVSGAVQAMPLDLGSAASVRSFAAECQSRFGRLDVLINNAGVITRNRERTQDGHERQFGVNHLGHFLLTRELMPMLAERADPRVVIVSSAMHRAGEIAWDDLNLEHGYGMIRAYAQSKLANVMFAVELARRAPALSVNALHPGGVTTGILREAPLMRALAWPFSKRPATAARAVIRLATDPTLAGVSGRYFEGMKETRPAPAARDAASAGRLWGISEALTELPRQKSSVSKAPAAVSTPGDANTAIAAAGS